MSKENFVKDLTNNNSDESRSLWMEVNLPTFPRLVSNSNADVCIVGAGIAGLTCAYTLAKRGKSVIVVDQGPIAGGQTARTTAHLTFILGDRYDHLESLFGEEKARLIAQSHCSAIDYIEKIVDEETIDCDFERVSGYLFAPPENPKEIIDKEFIAIRKTGAPVEKVPGAPFSSSFDTGQCLKFPNQAQFHILKYLQGLVKAILKLGGKIFTDTRISRFDENSVCTSTTESGMKITSQSVVVATCTPVIDRFYLHTKQAGYRTYVIAASVPKGSVPKNLYWDTADPYHYIRVQDHLSDSALDWVIIGGEDHKTGQDPHPDAKYAIIEKWARERIPVMNKVEYRWSGQVFEPVDSIAFIGKNPGNKNIYVATGDAGNGITHGTIAGILIPDLILDKINPWKELYRPSRKTLSASSEFIHENLNTVKQYGDLFTPGEKKELNKLKIGEGIILRKGIKKIAVYRDKQNTLHINSAFCPHLGGCVRWNQAEKSWDCPCHGSRFNGTGKVITGPANRDLCPCRHNEPRDFYD